MNFTKTLFLMIGAVSFLGSLVGTIWGASGAGGEVGFALIWMFVPLMVMGAVFLLVARYLSGLDTSQTIANGVPATAEILSVQDTGVTINNLTMVVKLKLRVTVQGAPPYEAQTRVMLHGRTQWGALQPGMTVPVKVDPNDPQKVALDESGGSAASMTPEVMAQAVNTVLSAGGPAAGRAGGMTTLKAADIISRGVRSEGRLLQVTPTGLTASQASEGLEPDEADDPLVVVAFTYAGEGGREERQQAVVRVPDGKAAFLAAGATVPVAYIPGKTGAVTIDWSRLN